jgi:RNA polymerase sigma-70 factor (ECF subfamily)
MTQGHAMMQVDTETIQRAQQGDLETLSALYEKYYLGIYRYLYYQVGDRPTAEDLTSEVFVRMLRFIAGFQPPSATFQSWLYQIARNLAIDHHRRMNRHDHLSLRESMSTANDSITAAVERRLTHDTLRAALAQLTDDQRDVILMRFVAGMPIADTARALHKSEDAIKGLQRRALVALRGVLTEWEVTYE